MVPLRRVIAVIWLAQVVGLAAGIRWSGHANWLRADGTSSWFVTEFAEGDTAILQCRFVVGSDDENATLYADPLITWKGSRSQTLADPFPITDGEQVVYYDGRDRFSDVNITRNDRTVSLEITISNVDRYDSGTARFFCKLDRTGGVASGASLFSIGPELKVMWGPPTSQCSANVDTKATKGDDVSYECSSLDADPGSAARGSLTLWKNGTKLTVRDTDTAVEAGTQYNVSYTTTITDDSVYDEYVCRYSGTGGFEEYNSNCSYDKPSCVVDTFADLCTTSGAAGLPSRDHILILTTIGLPIASIYWIMASKF